MSCTCTTIFRTKSFVDKTAIATNNVLTFRNDDNCNALFGALRLELKHTAMLKFAKTYNVENYDTPKSRMKQTCNCNAIRRCITIYMY